MTVFRAPEIRTLDGNPLLEIYLRACRHIETHHPDRWHSGRREDRQASWWGCPDCLGPKERLTAVIDAREWFSYAIPTPEAIEAIRDWSPHGIVEVGAGGGYWAALITAAGGDVAAFDLTPPGMPYAWCRSQYHPVYHASARESAAAFPERTLMLCWPALDDPMAADALVAYRGQRLVYVGEGRYGCNGDEAFFDTLESAWTLAREIEIPQWSGLRDTLRLYERRPREAA